MRKVITVEQAETLWQSGVDVWLRFPYWPPTDMDRSFRTSSDDMYTPATLHTACDVGGQWHHLNVGLPIYSVEVE